MQVRSVLLTLLATARLAAASSVDLLTNGGFEWRQWEWQTVWGHRGHDVIEDGAHSGKRCLHFAAQGAVKSLRYSYRGGPVRVTGWYRLRGVKQGARPWYRFWITVNCYDAQGKGIGHVDALFGDGTCEWTCFERELKSLPKGTAAIELSVALHNCTGEAWVDDLQVTADARLRWPAWKFTEQPYYTGSVLPRPQSCTYGKAIPVWDATKRRHTVRLRLADEPCRGSRFGAEQIEFRLLACARYLRVRPSSVATPEDVTVCLGRVTDMHVQAAAKRLGVQLPKLGPQGHAVRMVRRERAWEVLAAGYDDQGVAYAAASMVQMVGFEEGRLVLRQFDLEDGPKYLRRAGGDYGPIREDFLARLVLNRVPVYSIQHRAWWKLVDPDQSRVPGQNEPYRVSLKRMHDWVQRTGAMELMFLVHIYTTGGRPREIKGPAFDIADEQDVADLARRLKWLYGLGFRIQMVCVDDYVDVADRQYVCKTEAERERFGSIGRAHGYLMRRLWEILHPTCPVLKLSFVSGPYSQWHLGHQVSEEAGRKYLSDMAEEMPDEVAVAWTGPRIVSHTITRDDWRRYQALIPGHPLYVWDNCQSGAPIPMFEVDFYDGMERDSAWNLIYLNAHFVGWPHTMPAHLASNDYLWRPEGYDATASHEEAFHKAFGDIPYEHVRAVNDGAQTVRRMIRGSGYNKDTLVATVKALFDGVEALEAAGFPMAVPKRHLTRHGITPTIPQRFGRIPLLRVPRASQPPKLDGRLDDPMWEHAVSLPAFTYYKDTEAKTFDKKLSPTECCIAYDANALYIAVLCQHQGVVLHRHEHVGKRDAPIYYGSDAVEVFIDPDPSDTHYAHIAVDHTNTVFDEAPKGNASWDGVWQSAVRKEHGVWQIEIRLPFAANAIAPPKPGTRWKANFCRSFAQDRRDELSSWAPIYGSFHNWPFFGWLRFE